MFRLSIRELILLAAAISLAAGWWADRVATKRRYDLRLSAIESLVRREGWIVTQHDGSVSFRHKDGKRQATSMPIGLRSAGASRRVSRPASLEVWPVTPRS